MYCKSLIENGWSESKASCVNALGEEMIRIAQILGNPVVHRKSSGFVQKLTPIDTKMAYPNSLSSQHSYQGFPLHVDTAHWATPCRYVILGCFNKGAGDRNTILMDFFKMNFSDAEKGILSNAPFKITNGRNSFYGTILSKKRKFIRYDLGCMEPSTDQGCAVKEIFSEKRTNAHSESISWDTGKILVIDNWRMLHGRANSAINDSNRVLYRVLAR